MKLFRSISNNLAILGICPSLLHQTYPFNAKMVIVYLCYWLQIILHSIYLSRIAHTIEDCSDLIYRISMLLLVVVSYTIYMTNVGKIFGVIDMCEKIIDKSKKIYLSITFLDRFIVYVVEKLNF